MFAMILSLLVLDDPQGITFFPPEVYSRHEYKPESRPLSHQDTPFILQYEWKLNRDEAAVSAAPSNRETWTEFATVLQIKLPNRIEQEASDKLTRIMFSLDCPSHNLWIMAMAHRYPISQSTIPVVRYQITKKPTAIASQYEGVIHCVPAITARAKTIEALEAKLLEMYCDYITQMVEEDTQHAVNNAKANNPLERAPRGILEIPAVQFGY